MGVSEQETFQPGSSSDGDLGKSVCSGGVRKGGASIAAPTLGEMAAEGQSNESSPLSKVKRHEITSPGDAMAKLLQNEPSVSIHDNKHVPVAPLHLEAKRTTATDELDIWPLKDLDPRTESGEVVCDPMDAADIPLGINSTADSDRLVQTQGKESATSFTESTFHKNTTMDAPHSRSLHSTSQHDHAEAAERYAPYSPPPSIMSSATTPMGSASNNGEKVVKIEGPAHRKNSATLFADLDAASAQAASRKRSCNPVTILIDDDDNDDNYDVPSTDLPQLDSEKFTLDCLEVEKSTLELPDYGPAEKEVFDRKTYQPPKRKFVTSKDFSMGDAKRQNHSARKCVDKIIYHCVEATLPEPDETYNRLPVSYAMLLNDLEQEKEAMYRLSLENKKKFKEKQQSKGQRQRSRSPTVAGKRRTQPLQQKAAKAELPEMSANDNARVPPSPLTYEGLPDEKIEGGWPDGWIKRMYARTGGDTKGKTDRYWFSPLTKKKLRSIPEVKRFIAALRENGGDEDMAWNVVRGRSK